ncbi:MAG TPA: hypothetical protein VLS44_04245 [Nitrospira sp.]|nr:hypothetical protein [Nitrospira sp.]
MAEICYSRGRKIIIHTEQNRHGVWISRFTIPGLWEATPRKSGNRPLDTYKSEWDAKTVAFEAAKRVLDSVMTDANDRIPGGHHGPHFAKKTTTATNSTGKTAGKGGAP